MKPEEIRDDIPADVREALAKVVRTYGGAATNKLCDVIRKRPATVILPRAEIPAPLSEVPESGVVWALYIGVDARITRWRGRIAQKAASNGIAYATEEDAQAVIDAMMAREPVEEETKADDLSSLIPWAYLDPKWQWAAMDASEKWFVYEDAPSEQTDEWTAEEWGRLPIPNGAPVHWTETRVRRPEGV
jgi:hypothetical protein